MAAIMRIQFSCSKLGGNPRLEAHPCMLKRTVSLEHHSSRRSLPKLALHRQEHEEQDSHLAGLDDDSCAENKRSAATLSAYVTQQGTAAT